MKTDIHFLSYLAQFFVEWEMLKTKVVQKVKTHILCSVTFFFSKNRTVWDNVEKYCRAEHATDDNMALAHWMLDTESYKHTLRTFNTYSFSSPTMVTLTLICVTSYAHGICVWIMQSAWFSRSFARVPGTTVGIPRRRTTSWVTVRAENTRWPPSQCSQEGGGAGGGEIMMARLGYGKAPRWTLEGQNVKY